MQVIYFFRWELTNEPTQISMESKRFVFLKDTVNVLIFKGKLGFPPKIVQGTQNDIKMMGFSTTDFWFLAVLFSVFSS